MKPRLILSANATLHEGGLGLNLHHMIEGLSLSFDLSIYSRLANAELRSTVVPNSGRADFINRLRVLRRLRDWRTHFSNVDFDRYVAGRLEPADIFQGVTGGCAESLLVAKSLGCRTVVDSVTTHIDDFGSHQDVECAKFGVRPSLHPRLRERMRAEYERAGLIRVMSTYAESTFLERGFAKEKLAVVPPPIDVDEFPAATFSESKFRVSFVGLIEPWKGFHYLVEAFESLKLSDSELVLWGGSGSRPVSKYLDEHTRRNPTIKVRAVEVRSLGYGEVYAKSSVLVHPSLADGFGYVVAEAMASGIPVIVTRNTGAAELVEDGKNGYVIAAGDRDAIADRLRHLALNPALLRKMGAAARAAANSLTFEKFRQRMQDHLGSLLGAPTVSCV